MQSFWLNYLKSSVFFFPLKNTWKYYPLAIEILLRSVILLMNLKLSYTPREEIES